MGLLTIVILTAVFAVGCNKVSSYENATEIRTMLHRELDADTTMETRTFLAMVDSCNLHDEEQCDKMYDHIRTYTFDNSSGRHSSQTLRILQSMLRTLEHSDRRSKADMRSLLNLYVRLGATYEEAGMPAVGLDYYMRGVDYCNDSTLDRYKAMFYNNIGILYAKGDMLNDAERYFKQAADINVRKKIHHQAFLNYINLTELYLLKGDYDSAYEASKSGMDHLDSRRYPEQLGDMRIHQGNIYMSQGVYDMAMSRFQSALDVFEECGKESGVSDAYLGMGEVYLKRGLPDSARIAAQKALHNSATHRLADAEASSLSLLSKIYEGSGSGLDALRLIKRSMHLSDSLRIAENRFRLSQWDVLGKSVVLEKQADKSEFTTAKIITGSTIAVLCVALVLFLWYYLRKRSDNVRLENQCSGLKNELEKYHREEASISMERLSEQERIASLCDDLRQVLLEINPKERAKKAHLRDLLTRLDNLSNPKGNEEFKVVFERVDPDFSKILDTQFPFLTERDRRLCVFLYLGMSTKEIATLTSREVRSVESARNRLRKKLGLEQTDDLSTYLRSTVNAGE